jgi:hypothetical protein
VSDDALDPGMVRRALAKRAASSFPRWEVRGQWKDPARLYQSFVERLAASQNLDKLINCGAIPINTRRQILRLLVSLYDDPAIPTFNPPEWKNKERRKVETRSRRARKRASLLEKEAAEILEQDPDGAAEQKAEAWDLRHGANQAQAIIDHYDHPAPPGNPLTRGKGRPTAPGTAFVEFATQFILEEYRLRPEAPRLGDVEMRRLLDDLAADFWAGSTRRRLQERRRATARRRRRSQPDVP